MIKDNNNNIAGLQNIVRMKIDENDDNDQDSDIDINRELIDNIKNLIQKEKEILLVPLEKGNF